jgi:hypothetical protein
VQRLDRYHQQQFIIIRQRLLPAQQHCRLRPPATGSRPIDCSRRSGRSLASSSSTGAAPPPPPTTVGTKRPKTDKKQNSLPNLMISETIEELYCQFLINSNHLRHLNSNECLAAGL